MSDPGYGCDRRDEMSVSIDLLEGLPWWKINQVWHQKSRNGTLDPQIVSVSACGISRNETKKLLHAIMKAIPAVRRCRIARVEITSDTWGIEHHVVRVWYAAHDVMSSPEVFSAPQLLDIGHSQESKPKARVCTICASYSHAIWDGRCHHCDLHWRNTGRERNKVA